MAIGLGLDTGGTYTDAVLYDFDAQRTLFSSKALTTYPDAAPGIRAALCQLPPEWLRKATLSALSTTLATNACVEGKGCCTALFLLGYESKLVDRLGEEYGLTQTRILHVAGRHGQRGEGAVPLDEDSLRREARALRGQVDALGVVEYWGLRNPEMEMRAKAILLKETGLPVAAAHELSAEPNSLRRAATTCLNARLLLLIAQWLESAKEALRSFGVTAPVMLVRGDGSLMREQFARERPVETMLSGPAASAVGGMRAAGLSDCVVLDMGGTTSDLCLVRDGRPSSTAGGVDVGSWRTGTRAIRIQTIGLGGDSHIALKKGELALGPRRALPLCALAAEHPEVKDTLRELLRDEKSRSFARGEFLMRGVDPPVGCTALETAIWQALGEGPLSLEQLADRVGERPFFLPLGTLEFLGAVRRSALTPTDLMHIRGSFQRWDAEASQLGWKLLALQLECRPDWLLGRVETMACETLYRMIARYLLEDALPRGAFGGESFLDLGFSPKAGASVDVQLRLPVPLVAIGAPTHLFMPRVAERFFTECRVPENAAVAGAVGAITGGILAEATVLVRPDFQPFGIGGYFAYAGNRTEKFDTVAEAMAWSRLAAAENAEAAAAAMGAGQTEVAIEEDVSTAMPKGSAARETMLETRVTARALGKVRIGDGERAAGGD